MSVSQLAYLGIGVSDMPAWKSFATDILGMQVTERGDDGTVYLRMDENHHRIALHPSGEDDVLYTPMPMFWVGGFSFTLIAAMHAGATLVFEDQFDPPVIEITHVAGHVPAVGRMTRRVAKSNALDVAAEVVAATLHVDQSGARNAGSRRRQPARAHAGGDLAAVIAVGPLNRV